MIATDLVVLAGESDPDAVAAEIAHLQPHDLVVGEPIWMPVVHRPAAIQDHAGIARHPASPSRQCSSGR